MKYCTKCGKELMDEAVLCVGCGCLTSTAPVHRPAPAPVPAMLERKRTNWIGWPIIGLALQVLLFILAFVPGTIQGIFVNAQNNELTRIPDSFAPTIIGKFRHDIHILIPGILWIGSLICSAIFFSRQCWTKNAQRGHLFTISFAVLESVSFVLCSSHIRTHLYHSFHFSTPIIHVANRLDILFYIQLFLYLSLIIISILGCVIKHNYQQKFPQ